MTLVVEAQIGSYNAHALALERMPFIPFARRFTPDGRVFRMFHDDPTRPMAVRASLDFYFPSRSSASNAAR